MFDVSFVIFHMTLYFPLTLFSSIRTVLKLSTGHWEVTRPALCLKIHDFWFTEEKSFLPLIIIFTAACDSWLYPQLPFAWVTNCTVILNMSALYYWNPSISKGTFTLARHQCQNHCSDVFFVSSYNHRWSVRHTKPSRVVQWTCIIDDTTYSTLLFKGLNRHTWNHTFVFMKLDTLVYKKD